MSDEVVLTLRGPRYYRHWWKTLKTARKNVAASDDSRTRRSIRLKSLAGTKRPIFILGCPRSGTTYLGSLLAELPGVSYYFEPAIMKYYSRLIYEGAVSRGSIRRFYRWGSRSLMLAAPGRGHRFLEKNPKHTWVAESLLDAFPNAQFIIITRDGRDVAVSLREKPWHLRSSLSSGRREPGGYLYGPYPHFYIEEVRQKEFENTDDLHRCIWIWRRYAEQVEYLRGALPEAAQFHLRYEDLVQQPDETIINMLRFLGEDDPKSIQKVMAFSKNGKCSSAGRWRQSLSHEELQMIDREAGSILRKLDYE